MVLLFVKAFEIKAFFLTVHNKIQGGNAKVGRYNSNTVIQVDWLQTPKVINDER